MRKVKGISLSFLRKDLMLKSHLRRGFRLYRRSLTVLSPFLGCKFNVYNGRTFRTIVPNNELYVGWPFGVFSYTRRIAKGSVIHMRRKKKR